MAKIINIRNMPDALHRKLQKRARARGLSTSAYVRGLLHEIAEVPTPEDIRRRIQRLRRP